MSKTIVSPAVETKINELNSNKANIDTSHNSSTTQITNLDNVPINAIGRLQLAAAVSPIGDVNNYNYISYGTNSYRSIIITDNNNKAWVARKAGGAWSSWKTLANEDDIFALNTVIDTSSTITGLREGMNAIVVNGGTTIGGVTLTNKCRGYAVYNQGVAVGFITNYQATEFYTLGASEANSWQSCKAWHNT